MRACKKCNVNLPLSSFYIRKNGIPYTMCKKCYNQDKKQRAQSRSHISVDSKVCRRCEIEKSAVEFHKNNTQRGGISSLCKDCSYLTNLEIKYHIDDIDRLIAERNGLCDICSRPFGKRPNVDHDHSCCPTDYTCGKCFRGLLCSGCNMGLGHFQDNVVSMSNAVSYISTFNSTRSF